jgi:peptidoglycan biosynthesis protein MviN/MurJ (putative lipid II flippase)
VLTASVLTTPIYLYQVRHCIGVNAASFFGAALRPMLASLIMIFTVHAFLPEFSNAQSTLQSVSWLAGGVVVGVTTYISVMLIMWLVLSRPDGAESMLIDKIHGRIRDRWLSGSSGA